MTASGVTVRDRPTIIIPWHDRDDAPQWRADALGYVTAWWKQTYPAATIAIGRCPGDRPWSKGAAVAAALAATSGDETDICVMADADVVCDGIGQALSAVADDVCRWAVPHRMVYRLTSDATRMVRAGYQIEHLGLGSLRNPYVVKRHVGVAGGGMVVTTRGTLDRVPIDPRFRGYGPEDFSWGRALTMTYGHPWRGGAMLVHLWHPSGRVGQPDDEVEANRLLGLRYRAATTLGAVEQLLDEARRQSVTVAVGTAPPGGE